MKGARTAPGLRGLAARIPQVARTSFRKRGFAETDVLTRWPLIVGETLARHSCPEKLSYGAGKGTGATLKIRVAPGWALEIQHLEHLVIERINGFYGYRAVNRLSIIQGPVSRPEVKKKPKPRPLTADEEAELASHLEGVSDPELRASLQALGRSLIIARDREDEAAGKNASS